MFLGDVVNEFLNENRFSNTSPSEETCLSSSQEGGNKIDHLNSCFKNFSSCRLLDKLRSFTVNRRASFCFCLTLLVDGISRHVEHASKCFGADGNRDGRTRGDHFHSTLQSIGGVHGNRTD